MKRSIVSTVMFSAVSVQLPLIIACQSDKNQMLYERLMIISGVRTFLGLIDENDSPKLQPFFDDNYKLVAKNFNMCDCNDEEFLSVTFLDDQKHAKDAFSLQFLTNFLKLTPDEDKRFDLSDILFKVDRIDYFKIETKSLPDSNEKVIVFTDGIINFVFVNKSSNAKIEGFNAPIKDVEVDIFNKMFNDKFFDQDTKDENYNKFFNADRDLDVSGFEIGKTIADVKVKLSKSAQLVEKLQNILTNFKFKLDDLIKFNIKLNHEKSNVNSSETDETLKKTVFKDGDFIDIEFTLSIPNGDVGRNKKSTTDFSITLTKGPL